MTDYKKMYLVLFNAVTEAIEKIRRNDSAAAKATLIAAQQKTEEMYMEDDDYGQ